MSNREALLKKISVARFAAWELHMYLDTHPHDKRALKSYKQYEEKANALTAEFEEKFGPLTAGDLYGDSSWQWINNPWPWEKQEDDA
ncbi:MAG: spore coat protein CotJB [Clostridia bacterium]|nr:spore coat protein CotJB [Clostridia bacterium]